MGDFPWNQPLLSESALHLIRRFTYGFNSRLEADVLRFSDVNAWFENQLRAGADPAADATLKWYPYLADSPAKAWTRRENKEYYGWQYGSDFAGYTVARRIVAKNQVKEVMADFWSNLLYIPTGEDSSYPWRLDYDRVIRANALTSFKQLLNAAIVHPSMSGFLSNHRNTKTQINENLGRELLELHTVGRGGGYDEDDVKASAQMLTGFTLQYSGTFKDTGYDPSKHHVGAVTIMGKRFANASGDGRAELKNYLDWLATHEATAARIARRLCTRFVSDEPDDAVVNAVKQTYLQSGTDIKACLRTLIAHPSFKGSSRKKARTPIEDVIAAERACDIVPTGAGDKSRMSSVTWYCSFTGQSPFSWPRPDGFPEKSDTYLSPARLLRSWTIHSWTANPGQKHTAATAPAPISLVPPVWPIALADLVHQQSVMMTGARATSATLEAAATLLGKSPGWILDSWYQGRTNDIAWVITQIRATILNAPEAMLR